MLEAENTEEVGSDSGLGSTFLGLLAQDVISAWERNDESDSQATRRDMIRTMFVAVEGLVWEYRNHVRSIADDIHPIPPVTAMALAELTYSVTENGDVKEQTRFISIPTMIRLTTRLAEEFSPELKVDFGGTGWSAFREAIAIRNRVTHPKKYADLELSIEDVRKSQLGFMWLFRTVRTVMGETNATYRRYAQRLEDVSTKLFKGDTQTWAAYRAALSSED
jgi:hypothetical protein